MPDEMRVGELRELLEDENEDAIVRIVHQESWPLQEVVGGVASGAGVYEDEPDEEPDPDAADADPVVFLVANGHPQHGSPYGPKGAWSAMRRGWRR